MVIKFNGHQKRTRHLKNMSPLISSTEKRTAEDAAGVRVQSELALYSNVEAMKSNKKTWPEW